MTESYFTFEGSNWDMRNNRVKLLLSLLIIIALAFKSHSNTVWHILDSVSPNNLVQFGIETDVQGSHIFFDKLADSFDGGWSTLLEGSTSIRAFNYIKTWYFPWTYLWRWIVHSRVITSAIVRFCFFSFPLAIYSNQKGWMYQYQMGRQQWIPLTKC